MILRKIIYSEAALSKRKAIKRNIRERYGPDLANKISRHVSKTISKLKNFPQMGVSMRKMYGIDCDYYMIFIEHNYFIYRIDGNIIMILEIFNEKEDFMYKMFGVVTTSQDTLDYWGEE